VNFAEHLSHWYSTAAEKEPPWLTAGGLACAAFSPLFFYSIYLSLASSHAWSFLKALMSSSSQRSHLTVCPKASSVMKSAAGIVFYCGALFGWPAGILWLRISRPLFSSASAYYTFSIIYSFFCITTCSFAETSSILLLTASYSAFSLSIC